MAADQSLGITDKVAGAMPAKDSPASHVFRLCEALSWRSFAIGFAAGCSTLLAIAMVWGPKTEETQEDPLTGRLRHTTTWLGVRLRDEIETHEVSAWADANSVAGIYPGQYGWTPVTSMHRGWFTGTTIACGGYGIPGRIYRGDVQVAGLDRAEILQKHQRELIDAFAAHGSVAGVQRRWFDEAFPKNSSPTP